MYSGHKLRNLLEDTEYSIIQTNGQRIYGLRNAPHDFFPPKGSELFVGKLPRNVYEDELVPLFSRYARIYQLRLMVDFMGHNRGYCFVRYFTHEAADESLRMLNNYEIRRDCRIGVFKSVDNTRLFVGGIPYEISKQQLQDALEEHMEDIKNVIMYPLSSNPCRNRGYAFLEFENHRAAAIARRRTPPGSLMLWGVPIRIDWADPVPQPDPETMSKVTTLYLRNIPVDLTSKDMNQFLSQLFHPHDFVNMQKCNDYGFLNLTNRVAAEEAITILNGLVLHGHVLEVTWARPRKYSKKQLRKMVPMHFCQSLPAKQKWIIRKKRSIVRNAKTDFLSDVDSTSQQSCNACNMNGLSVGWTEYSSQPSCSSDLC